MTVPTWEIRQGDVLERLREMPDESVHCVVTSPPYFGLRDYQTGEWKGGNSQCDHQISGVRASDKSTLNGGKGVGPTEKLKNDGVPFRGDCGKCGANRIDSQLGLESTPDAYVAKMVAVFREVRRVLRSDGSCWVNLGDSYVGGGGFSASAPSTADSKSGKYGSTGALKAGGVPTGNGLKAKDLVGIPWMVAFALRADGWYLRSDIIWSKPNPMPESVTDRPTKSHEYVFLLSKSAKYFFDQEAVKEIATSTDDSLRDRDNTKLNNTPGRTRMGGLVTNGYHSRNIRSVWNIATQPFAEAHFATFPERLVDRCISAGTSEKGICGECGKPWVRVVSDTPEYAAFKESERDRKGTGMRSCNLETLGLTVGTSNKSVSASRVTEGWRSQCDHMASPIPATVMDIFSGSGTSGVVAHRLGRNYIGIELNPQYVAMSERRLGGTIYQPSLFG